MRWFLSLVLFLVFAGAAIAAGPDDQYLDIYNEVLQADNLQHDGQARAAAIKYAEAQSLLKQFKTNNPGWNPDVIGFRLQYLSDKLLELGNVAPATSAPAAAAAPASPGITPVAPAVALAAPASRQGAALQGQISGLQEQVRALTEANAELQAKLKEALSIQPSAVSPVELSKREEEIVELKKERDLLKVSLDQATQAAGASAASTASSAKLAADLAAAQHDASEANKKLETKARELAELKAAAAGQVSAADAARLTQERDKLKEELAARTKDLADSEAHHDKEVLDAQGQLKEAVAQRDDLRKKLDAANAANGASAVHAAEAEALRARLAVLEAKAVPYTAEELAVLHSTTPRPLAPAEPPAAKPHVAHSNKELPLGTEGLWREATRASMARDYVQAEEKYKEILHQDENNVFILAFLADAQFSLGHLEDCEKTVSHAIALDPDDPPTLYVQGLLRYRQDKKDEALTALSRSAELDPKRASTQNFLGCVLADKGMRPQAETAFRKALQLEPDYGDAHYNLAFVYATEKPPSLGLARWHYKRAVDLGHPKNASLEATLASNP